jgi:hypothetical protein
MAMKKRQKLLTVLRHMFSRKTIGYITLSFLWTMVSVVFWSWINTRELVFFESIEITLTIMGGKLILYGVWDWLHLKETGVGEDQRIVQIVTPEEPEDKFGEHCVL